MADGDHVRRGTPQVGADPEGLADREDRDGHHDNVDAVDQQRLAEGEPLLTGDLVGTDQADRQAQAQGAEAAQPRLAEDRGDG